MVQGTVLLVDFRFTVDPEDAQDVVGLERLAVHATSFRDDRISMLVSPQGSINGAQRALKKYRDVAYVGFVDLDGGYSNGEV
jgi:hypothetical protein